MEENAREDDRQALEPVLQEEIPFKGHTITAVRLGDGRIAVVLRWVCDVLNLDPQGQVQRIQRTAAIAGELLRVKVQPRVGAEKPRRGGGPQVMPVLTLRGFSPWILGINPNEVAEDPHDPEKAEHIRQLIIAYQLEAVDVLYNHFMLKAAGRAVISEEARAVVVPERFIELEPIKPNEPEPDATDDKQATYYEDLALWALWKAHKHTQKWRGQVDEWRGSMEARIESSEAIAGLLPEIIERLGPEKISPTQQGQVRGYVKRLQELTGKPYQTIYDDLRLAFGPARYQDLLAGDWPQVEAWFLTQIERASRGNTRR
jgi:P22_AR N-terminal domain